MPFRCSAGRRRSPQAPMSIIALVLQGTARQTQVPSWRSATSGAATATLATGVDLAATQVGSGPHQGCALCHLLQGPSLRMYTFACPMHVLCPRVLSSCVLRQGVPSLNTTVGAVVSTPWQAHEDSASSSTLWCCLCCALCRRDPQLQQVRRRVGGGHACAAGLVLRGAARLEA